MNRIVGLAVAALTFTAFSAIFALSPLLPPRSDEQSDNFAPLFTDGESRVIYFVLAVICASLAVVCIRATVRAVHHHKTGAPRR